MKRIKIWIWVLFSGFSLYNILDGLHTYLLLKTGLIDELNPIMNFMMNSFGVVNGIIILKVISTSIVFFVTYIVINDSKINT